MGDILSNNQSSVDLFGIGLAVNSVYKYMGFKLKVTHENKEILYHVIRKHAITSHPKTKNFLEKILSIYEKDDLILSMSMLKILEYMDDELLDIVTSVLEIENSTAISSIPKDFNGLIYIRDTNSLVGNAILSDEIKNNEDVFFTRQIHTGTLIINNLALERPLYNTFLDDESKKIVEASMSLTKTIYPTKEFFQIREIYNS